VERGGVWSKGMQNEGEYAGGAGASVDASKFSGSRPVAPIQSRSDMHAAASQSKAEVELSATTQLFLAVEKEQHLAAADEPEQDGLHMQDSSTDLWHGGTDDGQQMAFGTPTPIDGSAPCIPLFACLHLAWPLIFACARKQVWERLQPPLTRKWPTSSLASLRKASSQGREVAPSATAPSSHNMLWTSTSRATRCVSSALCVVFSLSFACCFSS